MKKPKRKKSKPLTTEQLATRDVIRALARQNRKIRTLILEIESAKAPRK